MSLPTDYYTLPRGRREQTAGQKCQQNSGNKKCIQISTNMPSIDLVILEIDLENLNFEKTNYILHRKPNARVLGVKLLA